MLVGSPEWFFEKSQTPKMNSILENIESTREKFLKQFSPMQNLLAR